LTNLGKEKVLFSVLKEEGQIWDKKWRLVIFDIPEKRRIVRDVLRYQLKQFGFVPLQQSVWVTKRNCTDVLRNYIHKIGIKDWVTVVESDNVDF
jgi:phenylacetic acid degradation operon negative regulatory protein